MRRLLACSVTLLTSACLGPNPNATDDGSSGESTGTSADSTTDTTATDTTATQETGDPDPTCSDGMQNGNETDEDCGGDCDPCGTGDMCAGPEDCASKVCDGICAAPACDDEVQNGDESQQDCGGPCPLCVLDELHGNWTAPDADHGTQPAIDMQEDGRFAIAWIDVATDVRYRWFDEAAMPVSDGFVVVETVPEERFPAVRIREVGNVRELILAYRDTFIQNNGPDILMWSVRPDGGNNWGPVKVDELNPIAADGFGFDLHGDEAAFVWHAATGTTYARRYDVAAGAFVENQNFPVTDDAVEEILSLAYAEDGSYLVSWTENLGDFEFDAYVRRRSASGMWVGDAVAANDTNVAGIQHNVDATMLSDGSFIVVWNGATKADAEGGIAGRLLDSNGAPVGTELQINEILEGVQELPTVVPTANGFAVAWQDAATDTVRLRRFASDATPWYGDEAPWGATPNLDPSPPAMAANGDQLVLVWSAGTPPGLVGVRVVP